MAHKRFFDKTIFFSQLRTSLAPPRQSRLGTLGVNLKDAIKRRVRR